MVWICSLTLYTILFHLSRFFWDFFYFFEIIIREVYKWV